MTDIALRGAVMIYVMMDVQDDILYVNSLGDCRAVAGWWDLTAGLWRCDVTTSDHRGEDPVEAEA